MSERPRRGWREKVEPGLYRAHRAACRSSADRRPGRRCGCPYQFHAPGHVPGVTRTVTLEGTVREARAAKRAAQAAGRPQPPASEKRPGTVRELAVTYFRRRSPALAPATVRNRDDDYRLRIDPLLGEVSVANLTRAQVESWLAWLIDAASSRRMIVQTVATLRVILNAAVEWGVMRENPAARLRLPKPGADERPAAHRAVDADTLARIVASAGSSRTETMLRALAEVGLRRGEVMGLRWGDVNLAARRITVARQVIEIRTGCEDSAPMWRRRESATKSGRISVTAISSTFADRLADWYTESVVEGGAAADGYVWPGKDGGPMHGRSPGRALERACERAGVGEWVPRRDGKGMRFRSALSPHIARHSTASVMLSEGVPLPVVSAQLTHSDPSITARIYAHVVGDDLDRAAAVWEREHRAGDRARRATEAEIPLAEDDAAI